ncbi:hypothetical protein BZA70DRAFT_266570 [Myxozyma melibiosi]|uniref:Large ribosomal subunit protein uL30m n=1 Tax=Myxozyma melibiosi TaxID=54550 RepID=A0ABR1F8R8_9ASCO
MTAFRITLVRSAIGLPKKTNNFLKTLGLTHRGAVRYKPVTPSSAGLILRVKELVKVDVVDRKLTREQHNATQKSNSGYIVEKKMRPMNESYGCAQVEVEERKGALIKITLRCHIDRSKPSRPASRKLIPSIASAHGFLVYRIFTARHTPIENVMAAQDEKPPLAPYILQPLLSDVLLVSEDSDVKVEITCVEAWHSSLYLGTSTGEVLHYFQDPSSNTPSYMFASRQVVHPSRPHPITRILLLPTVSQALVLSHNSIAVFSLPEFSPVRLGRIREVNSMSLDLDKVQKDTDDEVLVTVFTKKLIRIIRVKEKDLRLVKDIDYPSALVGIQRSSIALVANEETYDLIDLNSIQKIPLFSICNNPGAATKLKPHVASVTSEEFFVTSGSAPDEPAVGLVVNLDGDVSRGTIAWNGYPTVIAVEYPYIAAVIGNELQLHSLETQELLQTLPFDTPPKLSTVSYTYSMPYPLLAEKFTLVPLLGEADESRLEEERRIAARFSNVSSSLFVYSNELGVQCLIPTPDLLRLDSLLDERKIEEVLAALNKEQEPSERAFYEVTYIRQKLSLLYFDEGNYVDAERYWNESGFDPRIVISLFNKEDVKGTPWLYAGVKEALKIPEKEIPLEALMVVKHYLAGWLERKGFQSVMDSTDVFHSVEVAYLRVLLSTPMTTKEEIYNFTDLTVDDHSFPESVKLLQDHKKYFALSRLYQSRKHVAEVCETWRKMISGEWEDNEFTDGEHKMTEYLLRCKDENIVWEYGLWLMRRNAELGIQVFTDPRRKAKINATRLKDEIRKIGGEAWRIYLEDVVFAQQHFELANELVLLYTSDVIEVVESNEEARQEIIRSYEEYRALTPPKAAYTLFLQGKMAESTNQEAVAMRLKFLNILQSDVSYDVQEVLRRIKPHEDFLVTEMVILYGKLSLHHSALHILCHSLADYDTAFAYCLYGGHVIHASELAVGDQSQVSGFQQAELFKLLLVEFLKLKSTEDRIKCTKRLLEGWGSLLDLQFVLQTIPDSWSVELISGFLISSVRGLLRTRKESLLMRGLSREENLRVSGELMDRIFEEGPIIERRM